MDCSSFCLKNFESVCTIIIWFIPISIRFPITLVSFFLLYRDIWIVLILKHILAYTRKPYCWNSHSNFHKSCFTFQKMTLILAYSAYHVYTHKSFESNSCNMWRPTQRILTSIYIHIYTDLYIIMHK